MAGPLVGSFSPDGAAGSRQYILALNPAFPGAGLILGGSWQLPKVEVTSKARRSGQLDLAVGACHQVDIQ